MTAHDSSLASRPNAALTVYYDGGCPICVREIAQYRRLRGSEQIEWQNVAEGTNACVSEDCDRVATDLTREAALARLHVRDANGQLLSGAAAFARLWQMFPHTRWLGRIAATPAALWVLEPTYRLFLRVRPLWRRPLPRNVATATRQPKQ